MGETDLRRRRPPRHHQAAFFEAGQYGGDAEGTGTGARQRFANRHQLERDTLILVQAPHPKRYEILQPLSRLEPPRPAPQPALPTERAGLDAVPDQLPEEQGIARARLPEQMEQRPLDRSLQHRGDELLHFIARQRLK
ncbi:MAG: hypothetical protein ACRD07_09640 [Acidimicrobiales bacterium]